MNQIESFMPLSTVRQVQYKRQSPELRQTAMTNPEETPSAVQVFEALDQFMDLGQRSGSRLAGFHGLNKDERALFASHLSQLSRLGIVGTETLEVRGLPRQSFVETAYADPELRDAPQYRRRPSAPLDLRG